MNQLNVCLDRIYFSFVVSPRSFFYITHTEDSQLTVMLTALLRPSAPSHQYSPLFPLAAVNTHVSDLSTLKLPPSGEQVSVWRTLFLTLRSGEKRLSIQPKESVSDDGHWRVKRSPLKSCLEWGVRVSEGGGSSGGQRRTQRGEEEKVRKSQHEIKFIPFNRWCYPDYCKCTLAALWVWLRYKRSYILLDFYQISL